MYQPLEVLMKIAYGLVFVVLGTASLPSGATGEPPGAQIPVDNCDKEITNGLRTCKPPVSITIVSPQQASTMVVPQGCVLTGQVLTCYE